jgi:hypothetical protein
MSSGCERFELRAPLLSEKVDREANRAPLAVKSFSGEFPAPKTLPWMREEFALFKRADGSQLRVTQPPCKSTRGPVVFPSLPQLSFSPRALP